jgi:predicted enzyme related to lactoylglutathione lyase
METSPKPSAVVFAKDIDTLTIFYREVLSMTIALADQQHVVLDAERFQLVIHGIPPELAMGITISSPPQLRGDVPIKLCLPVASIASARAKASRFGGMVWPLEHEWEAGNFRACDGYDPEGNVFQLREPR